MISVDNLKVLININMCCILPNNQQIENEGWLFDLRSQYKPLCILWLTQNIVTEMKNTAQIRKLGEMLIYETSIWKITNIYIYYLSMCLSHLKKRQILITHRNYMDY